MPHTPNRNPTLVVLIAAVAVAGVAAAAAFTLGSAAGSPAAAAAGPPAAGEPAAQTSTTTGVLVDGLGRVAGTPDVLRVELGVEVKRPDVSSALLEASSTLGKVRAAVSKAGVADRDVQTTGLNVYPAYDNKGRIDGYQVSEQVRVVLRDLGRAGRTIGAAVQAGGDAARLQGVSFSLEDNARLLAQARDAAYADARTKAERYADLAGRKLGVVQLVTETVSDPRPVAFATLAKAADAASQAVPIDAGTSQVSVSVQVRWSLA